MFNWFHVSNSVAQMHPNWNLSFGRPRSHPPADNSQHRPLHRLRPDNQQINHNKPWETMMNSIMDDVSRMMYHGWCFMIHNQTVSWMISHANIKYYHDTVSSCIIHRSEVLQKSPAALSMVCLDAGCSSHCQIRGQNDLGLGCHSQAIPLGICSKVTINDPTTKYKPSQPNNSPKKDSSFESSFNES